MVRIALTTRAFIAHLLCDVAEVVSACVGLSIAVTIDVVIDLFVAISDIGPMGTAYLWRRNWTTVIFMGF